MKTAWTNTYHTWNVPIASSVSPEGKISKPRVFYAPAELWLHIKPLVAIYESHSRQRQLCHLGLLRPLKLERTVDCSG